MHGANRLGGNGVAESTVFGGLAGDTIAAFVEGRAGAAARAAALSADGRRAARAARRAPAGGDSTGCSGELRDVMWERAGLVRDGEGLRARAGRDRPDRGAAWTPSA